MEQKRAVAGDPFDLDRFVQAQNRDYDAALEEIRKGGKHSHWMWVHLSAIRRSRIECHVLAICDQEC